MIDSNPPAAGSGRRVSSLVAPHRPSDRVHAVYARLEALASAYDLVLIPTGLNQAGGLPRVELGPDLTRHDIGEYVAMMAGLGARGLYVPNGIAHMQHLAVTSLVAPEGPTELRIECLCGGVLHVWRYDGGNPNAPS